MTDVTANNVVPVSTDVCVCGKVLTRSGHSKDCQIHSTFLICLESLSFAVYVLHAHMFSSFSVFKRANAMEVNARVHLQSTVILKMASFHQHRIFF